MIAYPDENTWWAELEREQAALYAQAGQSLNWAAFRWSARTAYDIGAGMDPEASKQKHLAELRAALGLPPIAPQAPRTYRGNMCGVRISGLPPVPGGAADSSLVLSWFYDRYDAPARTKIRATWRAKQYLDVLLSWPDSRSFGFRPEQFVSTCQELVADGFLPCVMLYSKDVDPPDVPTVLANIHQVLPLLIAAKVIPRACIGWELSIRLSPTQVQQLIDALCPQLTPGGTRVYVHFQQGYFAFQQPGHVTADFWNANVGKLTGVLHQKDLSWDAPMYQARIVDCLERFAGQDGFVADSGFGHPFDFIALEITAQLQFNGQMSEADGDRLGRVALATPGVMGPLGLVRVMGSGNGQ
jgi:hypothetical protein